MLKLSANHSLITNITRCDKYFTLWGYIYQKQLDQTIQSIFFQTGQKIICLKCYVNISYLQLAERR